MNILFGQKLLSYEMIGNTYHGLSNEPTLQSTTLSLRFSSSRFVIENPYRIIDTKNKVDETIDTLIGMTVTDFLFTKGVAIKIIFDSNKQIIISLKEEDYSSPEAASYNPDKGDTVVFN
jgi:hypothetical protein